MQNWVIGSCRIGIPRLKKRSFFLLPVLATSLHRVGHHTEQRRLVERCVRKLLEPIAYTNLMRVERGVRIMGYGTSLSMASE